MKTSKILVIGALGQIGSELVEELCLQKGAENVIASDIRPEDDVTIAAQYLQLNVMDKERLYAVIQEYQIGTIYNLAAILSAKGEQDPMFAWKLNMEGLFNTLEAAKDIAHLTKIFWPSSIAVFGPNSPRENTPQYCVMDPNTVYGISKLAGERWCEYYFEKYGVDVRSLRYPGLIGYKAAPGGGTTDYAVDIYHYAVQNKPYQCFLREDTGLPMMYMEDAIRATILLMDAPAEKIKNRSSYNLSGMSFSPLGITQSIQKQIPDFQCTYVPDFRQKIADSWPMSIEDAEARKDWGWEPEYDLEKMTQIMLENIAKQYPEVTAS